MARRRRVPTSTRGPRASLTSTSYLVWKLTGEYVIDHYTAANFSPLYDVERLDWTDELAPDIVPLERLPRLAWSTEIAGSVTAGRGRGDRPRRGHAGHRGHRRRCRGGGERRRPCARRDDAHVRLDHLRHRGHRATRSATHGCGTRPGSSPGRHASMAGLATSGTLVRWFRDELAPGATWEELVAAAEASPQGRARACSACPTSRASGRRIHDPARAGAFFGLDLTHTRGGPVPRRAGGHRGRDGPRARDVPRGRAPRRAVVLAVGGGTSNAVWLQATSDLARRHPAGARADHRRELRRRVPRRGRRRRGGARRHRRAGTPSPGRSTPEARAGLRPPVPPVEGAVPADARARARRSRMARA